MKLDKKRIKRILSRPPDCAAEAELYDEIVRLACLGLWAEQLAIPHLRTASDASGDERYDLPDEACNLIAALPKEKE